MKRLSFTLIIICSSLLYGLGQHLSEALINQFDQKESVDCIIVLKDQLNLYGQTKGWDKNRKANYVYQQLMSHADNSQAELIDHLTKKDISYQAFYVFNGIQAHLTKKQALYILEHFAVAKVVYDSPTQLLPEKSSLASFGKRSEPEWGISKINADSVWQMGYKGTGVVVGGQDTGYDFDNALILPKYRGYIDSSMIDHNYNWHDAIDSLNPLHGDTINDPSLNPCGFLSEVPCDDHGHGSHTMGTMVGSDTANQIGVAPAATWIGCRNMDRGWGKPSTYTECFEWFLAPTDLEGQNPDPSLAPHVINNSWGCPPIEGCDPDNWSFMETVVDNLTAAGTVVVVSAGNDGNSGCGSVQNPAAIFENSFSVGATRDDDSKPGFSSIGPVTVDSSGRMKPNVMAPGVGVRSIWLNDNFVSIQGTSMAGPHVAGAVALLINAKPSLAGQVDEIKDLLQSTAVSLIDSTECEGNAALEIPNFYFGYGRIDVLAAVNKALETVDVEEYDDLANDFAVYPNPNSGTFTISSNSENAIGEVQIRNLSGSLLRNYPAQNSRHHLVVEDLSPGMYIYTIQTGKSIISGKVVVSQN